MNTLHPEIREWIKKYCKLHNFRINGVDIPMEYITKDGYVIPNRLFVYTPKSVQFNSKNYIYWDKVTKAFRYLERISHAEDC